MIPFHTTTVCFQHHGGIHCAIMCREYDFQHYVNHWRDLTPRSFVTVGLKTLTSVQTGSYSWGLHRRQSEQIEAPDN